MKASMTSIHPASFSKIAPEVFGKFAIERSFLDGHLPIYSFVRADQAPFWPEFGSWLPQMASERKKLGGILKPSMTSIHPASFSKIASMVLGKFAIARSFLFWHQRCPYIRLSGPTTPLFGQNLGRSSLKWHRMEKSGGDILKPPMTSIHPASFSKIAP